MKDILSCQSEWPEVAIIILNWNNYEDTARCLSSLEDVNYPNYTIYVVDNASSDNSLQRLHEDYPWCRFIENSENQGFAGGCNRGIERALEDGMDHVLLLNNDTIVSSTFLKPLIKTVECNEKVALVGGIIEYMNEEGLWYAGSTFNPTLAKSGHQTTIKDTKPYHTEHVTGALMLLSGEFIVNGNYLDEDYFFGYEDVEISWRARRNGWKTLVAPDSCIQHEVSSTAGFRSPFKFYHATRNRMKFAQNLTLYKQVVFYTFFMLTRLIRAAQWYSSFPGRIKAIGKGIVDHLLGRPPRKPDEFDKSG
ncbi:glycosyltransferase family 2 protein [Halobacterium noricense]|uniref:glycosyltransferase family 2 protein n=1 Tax=Halobacterium noricense TaxID=223182 RepID=UPI001E5E44D5|nr:glycosyltransferase family 2 protein [Halobacterium noricense]UHH26572.1 glycosyltransferase family 2 protein [Halobacterium noricense]